MKLGIIRKATFLAVFVFCSFARSNNFVFAKEIHNTNQRQNCGFLGASECYLGDSYCNWGENSKTCFRDGENPFSKIGLLTTTIGAETTCGGSGRGF
jgi:hypothetical protein